MKHANFTTNYYRCKKLSKNMKNMNFRCQCQIDVMREIIIKCTFEIMEKNPIS